jgi:hypothetical protein
MLFTSDPDYHRDRFYSIWGYAKLNMHFFSYYVRTASEELVQCIHQKPTLRPAVR